MTNVILFSKYLIRPLPLSLGAELGVAGVAEILCVVVRAHVIVLDHGVSGFVSLG